MIFRFFLNGNLIDKPEKCTEIKLPYNRFSGYADV